MLKATELGLGTCAIKSYNDKAVHKLLKLPDTMRLEILISVGWPAAEPREPKRKAMEDVLFWNTWEEPEVSEEAAEKPEAGKEAVRTDNGKSAARAAEAFASENTQAQQFNKKELPGPADLYDYQRGRPAGEPHMYGPLRLIESSRRLAGMLGDAYGGAVFEELTALIDAGKGKNMTDPEGFCEMLQDAAAKATELL